ncbi:MAG: ComF family protein [Acidimicrobiia bacterium]
MIPPPGVATLVACARYEGAIRRAIVAAKYRGAFSVFSSFALVLASELAVAGPFDVVVSPPAAPEHRRFRGFDPAGVLAVAVARRLRCPYSRVLRRRGGAQTGRNRRDRSIGIELVAFRAVCARVLIIDDVVTTGATLVRAADALRRAGAQEVHAGVAALVGDNCALGTFARSPSELRGSNPERG